NGGGADLTGLRVSAGLGDGISAQGLTGPLTLTNSLVEANGNAIGENGVEALDAGLTVVASTVRGPGRSSLVGTTTQGVRSATVRGSTLTSAGNGGSARDGVRVESTGTGAVDAVIETSGFAGNLGDHVQVVSTGSGSATSVVRDNTLSGATAGAA